MTAAQAAKLVQELEASFRRVISIENARSQLDWTLRGRMSECIETYRLLASGAPVDLPLDK